MFQRRLKVFLAFLFAALVVLALRVIWLQIIRADDFLAEAARVLERSPQWIETMRGSIYDRRDRVLAEDRAGFDLCLHYKLTRIYDDRFWHTLKLRYADDAPDAVVTASRARRLFKNSFNISADHINNLLDGLEDSDPVPVEMIRQVARAKADKLIDDLAEICQLSPADFVEPITRINNEIYNLQVAVARRCVYRNLEQPTPVAPGNQAILDDLVRLLPDEKKRLLEIDETRVYEMTEPQLALQSLPEDIALTIEERFVGRFFDANRRERPILIRTGKHRNYPWQDKACHLVGTMRPATDIQDKSQNSPPVDDELFAYQIGDRQGDWGSEYMFEDVLRGRRGWVLKDIEDNDIIRKDPVLGRDVKLTIDIELQSRIQTLFQGRNSLAQSFTGAAVLIDVPTGQILAMVSVPTFDLNTYYNLPQYELINEIKTPDPLRRRRNRAIGVNYQPGSTIKPTQLLGILQQGLINAHTTFDCSYANKDWSGPPSDIKNHGPIASEDAVMRSCNFYFITVGQTMGSLRLTDWLDLAGFGRTILFWDDSHAEKAAFAFRETAGHVRPIGKDHLSIFNLRFVSIGRGCLDGSVLQIANAVSTIARDGVYISPYIILEPAAQPQPQRIASVSNAHDVQKAMRAVIYKSSGTGFKAFQPLPWQEDTVKLYGKTGSTDYSVFACFAQAAKDQRALALAVLAETEVHGSDVAAPLAREILITAAKLGYLPEPMFDD